MGDTEGRLQKKLNSEADDKDKETVAMMTNIAFSVADTNGDSKISRQEATKFVEEQLVFSNGFAK